MATELRALAAALALSAALLPAGPAAPALASASSTSGASDRPGKSEQSGKSANSGSSDSSDSAAAAAEAEAAAELRSWLSRRLEDEQAAVAAAAQATDEKLAAARAVLAQRAAVSYRVLRHTPRSGAAPAASSQGTAAVVRSRAAARWLLARDGDEVALLADEQARLTASRQRLAAAAARVAALPLPPRQLPWPAPGSIARGFGPFVHERSGATLSRRGLDLEVAEAAAARAMAAGTVVFAGPIRGLDDGVLIDHGDYLTLIAKLADLAVTSGQAVAAGEPLGKAARRRLYLELRLPLVPAGIPIDPAPFLAER